MLNFTVGPVMSSDMVRAIGQEQVPYFRTSEFSELVLECESILTQFAGALAGSRSLFITGSGTASMEATVMDVFTPPVKGEFDGTDVFLPHDSIDHLVRTYGNWQRIPPEEDRMQHFIREIHFYEGND